MKNNIYQCPYCTGEWANLCTECDEECLKFKSEDLQAKNSKYKMQSENKEIEVKLDDKRTKYSKIGIQCSVCKVLTHSKCLDIPIFAYLESPKYFFMTDEEKKNELKSSLNETHLQYVCQ